MRTAVLAIFIGLGVSAGAAAQPRPEPDPGVARLEVFFGYQVRGGVPSPETVRVAPFDRSRRAVAALDWNFGSRAALVIAAPEFGSYSDGPAHYSVLVGPRIRFGARGRVMPFAQALVGVRRGVVIPPGRPTSQPWTATERVGQIAVSGGFDIRLTPRLLLRAVQIEDQYVGGAGSGNSVAVSSGVVVRFGARK